MEKGDLASFYQAFALHLLGDPARGSEGSYVSGEAVTLGIELEPLGETLKVDVGNGP